MLITYAFSCCTGDLDRFDGIAGPNLPSPGVDPIEADPGTTREPPEDRSWGGGGTILLFEANLLLLLLLAGGAGEAVSEFECMCGVGKVARMPGWWVGALMWLMTPLLFDEATPTEALTTKGVCACDCICACE